MNVSLCFISFIIVNLISKIHSKTDNSSTCTDVGFVGCTYFGNIAKSCSCEKDVPVEKLPPECNSYFFDGVTVDLTYNVFNTYESTDQLYLDMLLKTGKPTYVYYGHISVQEWSQVLSCGAECKGVNAIDEMEGLKAYLNEHPGIAGIILTGLEYNFDSTVFHKYTDNLKEYLKVLHKTFPDLEIGMRLSATFLIEAYQNSEIEWLNLKDIDSFVNFYVISFIELNLCSNEFIVGGTAPWTGGAEFTIEKTLLSLKKFKISKDKTYFKFSLNPTSESIDTAPFVSTDAFCDMTFQKLCSNPNSSCDWCADTEATFREKGQLSKQYAAGFIADNVDMNDAFSVCQCDVPYPSFYYILDGWNGNNTHNDCCLFHRS